MYIILGNFNICVGSRKSDDDEWSGVREPYGFGSVNAGKELLSFLSISTLSYSVQHMVPEGRHMYTGKHGNTPNPNSGAV